MEAQGGHPPVRSAVGGAEILTHSVTPKGRGPPVASAMGHKPSATHQFPRLIQLSSALLVLRLFRSTNALSSTFSRRLSRQRRVIAIPPHNFRTVRIFFRGRLPR